MNRKYALMFFSVVLVAAGIIGGYHVCMDPSNKTVPAQNHGDGAQPIHDMASLESLTNIVPILIVGSGPAGLTAGIYGATQYTTVIIGGETLSLLAEASVVENWPGSPHQLGTDLVEKTRQQAIDLGAKIVDTAVEKIDTSAWPYKVYCSDGSVMNALTVIFATGAHPKKLGIPGEKQYWGRGVSACAKCDSLFFKGKKVAIAGGGDAAIEEATELARYASEVVIIHRRDKLRAKAYMQQRLAKYSQIKVLYNTQVRAVNGNGKKVTSLLLDTAGKQESVPFDGFFLAVGHTPQNDLIKDFITLNEEGFVVLNTHGQETNVPGFFAAGDVASPKHRQATIAIGDGARAAMQAAEYLERIGFTLKDDVALRKRIAKDAHV